MNPTQRQFLAELLKPITATAENTAPLTEEQKSELELDRAYVDLFDGPNEKVIRAIDRFANSDPKNARAVEGLAMAYMANNQLDVAADTWRKLIAGLSEGSPAWFRSKLQLAVCLRRAGDAAQARRVIELVEALHPDLGGVTTRQQYLEQKRRLRED
jgi:tetratricopeptide (TPR) repeat protein